MEALTIYGRAVSSREFRCKLRNERELEGTFPFDISLSLSEHTLDDLQTSFAIAPFCLFTFPSDVHQFFTRHVSASFLVFRRHTYNVSFITSERLTNDLLDRALSVLMTKPDKVNTDVGLIFKALLEEFSHFGAV